MSNSANPTMTLIYQFVNEGAVESIYRKRTILSATLFKEKIVNNTEITDLYSNELNMWSSVNEIWQKCSRSSSYFNCTCKLCGEYRTPISMIQVNHKLLWENGFGRLQQSIYSSFDSKIHYTKCKLNVVNRSLLFNQCICIELDISMYQKHSLKCSPGTMPTAMQLNNHNYLLRGIIEIKNNNFRAYCRRHNNYWGLYDDLAKKIQSVQSWEAVTPTAAIYSRID